jgi:hypothetical protein
MTKAGRKPRASCLVCKHPAKHEIEAARVAGVSLDAIAEKWKIDRSAVWRHCRNHVSASDRAQYLADVDLAEVAARAAREGGSILHYLALARSILTSQMLLGAQVNDRHGVATLAGKLTACLSTMARITGELSGLRTLNVTNNVHINNQIFLEIEAMLADRLKGHPDALVAVIEGLRDLGEKEDARKPEGPPLAALQGGEHAAAG